MHTGLNELLDTAVSHLPGAQYAGITLASHNHGISTAAVTERYPEPLDPIQGNVTKTTDFQRVRHAPVGCAHRLGGARW